MAPRFAGGGRNSYGQVDALTAGELRRVSFLPCLLCLMLEEFLNLELRMLA